MRLQPLDVYSTRFGAAVVGDNLPVIWLAFSAAMVFGIAGLWWYAWLRRKRKTPKPTQPYREWKD